jgi:hypothetical protein
VCCSHHVLLAQLNHGSWWATHVHQMEEIKNIHRIFTQKSLAKWWDSEADGWIILKWTVLPSGCGCTAPLKCGLIRILCGDCCWFNWGRPYMPPLAPGRAGGCTKLPGPKRGPANPCCCCCSGWIFGLPAAAENCSRGPPPAPRPTNPPLPLRPPLHATSLLATCLASSTHTLSKTQNMDTTS